MYDNDGDDMAQFSPEELQKLLGLGVMPERQQQLQQQLMQAQALRGGGQQRTSPMGALLGGIAGAGGELAAGLREKQLNQQMGDLTNQTVDARQLLMQRELKRLGLLPEQPAQPSPMGAGDVSPSGMFGWG